MDGDDFEHTVVDNGSGFVKIGDAGEDCPSSVIPNLMSWSAEGKSDLKIGEDVYCDYEKSEEKGKNICFPIPINGSEEVDIDKLLEFYNRCQLFKKPDCMRRKFLFTEFDPITLPKPEIFFEMIFETLEIPYLNYCNSSILALCAGGRTQGIVLDSGFGKTKCSFINECRFDSRISSGYARIKGIGGFKDRLGGKLLTDFLCDSVVRSNSCLLEHGNFRRESLNFKMFEKMKEDVCFCLPKPFRSSLQQKKDHCFVSHYLLPDKTKLILDNEQFIVPEVMFDPSIIGYNEIEGVHHQVLDIIKKTDKQLKAEDWDTINLYNIKIRYKGPIILSGGNTLLSGFPKRLENELFPLLEADRHIRIAAPKDRHESVWVGGSILGSLYTIQHLWTSKERYEEYGFQRWKEEQKYSGNCHFQTDEKDVLLKNTSLRFFWNPIGEDNDMIERIEFLKNGINFTILIKFPFHTVSIFTVLLIFE